MFTLCIALFASLTAVTPADATCYTRVTVAQVEAVRQRCIATDRDPLSTCEFRRAGALKFFVTVRTLAGDDSESPKTLNQLGKEGV